MWTCRWRGENCTHGHHKIGQFIIVQCDRLCYMPWSRRRRTSNFANWPRMQIGRALALARWLLYVLEICLKSITPFVNCARASICTMAGQKCSCLASYETHRRRRSSFQPFAPLQKWIHAIYVSTYLISNCGMPNDPKCTRFCFSVERRRLCKIPSIYFSIYVVCVCFFFSLFFTRRMTAKSAKLWFSRAKKQARANSG